MPSWTTPRTYIAGELLTASIANIHWRDNLLHLDTGRHVLIQGSQSVNPATQTIATLNSAVKDPNGWFNLAAYRFTPTMAGTYFFGANGYFSVASGTVQIFLFLNGAFLFANYDVPASGNDWAQGISGSYPLNGVSDYVDVRLAHGAGVARNVSTTFFAHRLGS